MAVGTSLLCGHIVLEPIRHKSLPGFSIWVPSAAALSLNPPPHDEIRTPVRQCLLKQADRLAQEETPHRELYMYRSLQLPPCIRAQGPQLGRTQPKKCPQHLPVACPSPEWVPFCSSGSFSACKPWPTCGELDSSAKEALPEENARLR